MEFDKALFHGYLLKGELKDAIHYLACFPEQAELYRKYISVSEIEEGPIAETFQGRGYCFLGGKTGGYWGPYIWKTTEETIYDVELPDGRQPYTVRFNEENGTYQKAIQSKNTKYYPRTV